jgi:hypothetical protein
MTKKKSKYEAYKIAAVVLRAMATHTPPIVPNTVDMSSVSEAMLELSELLALRADNIKVEMELESLGLTASSFNDSGEA